MAIYMVRTSKSPSILTVDFGEFEVREDGNPVVRTFKAEIAIDLTKLQHKIWQAYCAKTRRTTMAARGLVFTVTEAKAKETQP